MLAVAADPESNQPGRLAHDGPWWNLHAPRSQILAPEWCGECSAPDYRWVELDDRSPARCPQCHPLAKATRDHRSHSTGLLVSPLMEK
jgi:hypothetical protein